MSTVQKHGLNSCSVGFLEVSRASCSCCSSSVLKMFVVIFNTGTSSFCFVLSVSPVVTLDMASAVLCSMSTRRAMSNSNFDCRSLHRAVFPNVSDIANSHFSTSWSVRYLGQLIYSCGASFRRTVYQRARTLQRFSLNTEKNYYSLG